MRMLATQSLQEIAPLEFIRVTFIPRGTEEWRARRVGVGRSFEACGWNLCSAQPFDDSFLGDGFP